MCALTIHGQNILLSVERSIKDNMWTTDLPINNDLDMTCVSEGKLKLEEKSAVYEDKWIRCIYTLVDNTLKVQYEVFNENWQGNQVLSLNLRNEFFHRTVVEDGYCDLYFRNREILRLRVMGSSNTNFRSKSIESNPFGPGKRIEAISREKLSRCTWSLELLPK